MTAIASNSFFYLSKIRHNIENVQRKAGLTGMNQKGDNNRSVRATRRALQATMVTLLKEKEIRDISVKELAELADVSRSTFYLHYKDVYDLLEHMEHKCLEELRVHLTAESRNLVNGDVTPMMVNVFSHLYENQTRYIVLFGPNGRKDAQQQAMDTFMEYLLTIIERDYGIPRTTEVELGTRFFLEGSLGVMKKCYLSGKPMDGNTLAVFFARIIKMLADGFHTVSQ